MKPSAPFVAAHGSFPQGAGERDLWLDRYAAFAISQGVEPEKALGARSAVASMAAMIAPEEDEAILREAGFTDVAMFWAAFTWRGWIAYA